MTSFRWQRSLVLLPAISLVTAIILFLMSRRFVQSSATFELKAVDNNPDGFYLCATGRVFSYNFTYDPHAADDWMFRTAEGSMGQLNHRPSSVTNKPDDR
jgi:hypothetical protein